MVSIHSNYLMDWTEDSVRLIATPSGLAKSAFFYVQEIGHFYAREHYYTEREHVQSFLMVYTIQGGGKLSYRGETHSLRAGQVFFLIAVNISIIKRAARSFGKCTGCIFRAARAGFTMNNL
jgi:glyoxylate utilization-related uncharacterized protein